MAKSKKRKAATTAKTQRRQAMAAYLEEGGDSQYARKRAYCRKHNCWGFEVPFPKPWKGGM